MKKIIFLLLFIIVSTSFADTSSPRGTMKTFLKAMVQIKKQNLNHELFYKQATSTFDLSNYTSNIRLSVGTKYANNLIFILDRMEKVNYKEIPEVTKDQKWYYDKTRDELGNIKEISISLVGKNWYFSKETFQSLDFYINKVRSRNVVENVLESKLTESIRNHLPKYLHKKTFILEQWQWIGILVLLILAFLIERFVGFFATILVDKNFKMFHRTSNDHLKKALIPFRRLLFVLVLIPGIQYLDLSANSLNIGNRILLVLSSVFVIWLGHRLVEMISYFFQQKSLETENKFDDILIPLLTKTTFVLLYILGTIFVVHSFAIDITGIIAGLGIGGLAFAFAAKDTLANFFGSIMLVLDRPFDIGDFIKSGNIEGIVEEVGFRSTKIRAFDDSVTTISNGILANQAIDNFGKRRYRRLNTTLGLEYDTPPERVEAFCEGIRQIILSHKWTRKDNFNVYFVNFGASSLDIQLMVFWETPAYDREQAEKHRLMIDILRLAKEMKISFAFPTQTLHLFTENAKESHQVDEKYFLQGIETAKKITTKPLSLKNPRSNATDKQQFGDNDFGID